jgi:hypothetical protein
MTPEVARHVAGCAQCAAFRMDHEALWNLLDEWQPAPVSVDFNRRFWQQAETVRAGAWRRVLDAMRTVWAPAIPLAAMALLIGAAFLYDHPVAPPVSHSKDVEQVERTLDDIQLLGQFDSAERPL